MVVTAAPPDNSATPTVWRWTIPEGSTYKTPTIAAWSGSIQSKAEDGQHSATGKFRDETCVSTLQRELEFLAAARICLTFRSFRRWPRAEPIGPPSLE